MKNILIFLLGAAGGTVVSYVVLKKKFEKDHINENEAVVEYWRERVEYWRERAEGKLNECKEDDKDSSDEVEEREDIPEKLPKPKAKTVPITEDPFDYTSCSSGSSDEEEPIKCHTETPKNRKRFCISQDDFEEGNGLEKYYFTYFEEDETFMDENEQEVKNGEKMVGASNLKHITDYPDRTMYVRNLTEGCDIEITFEDGSYEDYCWSHGLAD